MEYGNPSVCTAPVRNRSFCSFLIDDDPDDLDMLGRHREFEHLLGVGHLRNCGRRNKTDGIDVREPGGDQLAQVVCFRLRRNLACAIPARHRVGIR